MLQVAEEQGFEVRDVENLREHYALTLSRWLPRLEDHAVRARQIAGEIKYRIWRLYLAGSMYYFETGRLEVFEQLMHDEENHIDFLETQLDLIGKLGSELYAQHHIGKLGED